MDRVKSYIILALCFLIIIFMCMFPSDIIMSVKTGINLCLETLIPSLFPFMFFINIILNSDFFHKEKKKMSVVIKIYILSLLGGYPIGSKVAEELYIKNVLDKKSANTIKCFATNAGPGFIILAIGVAKYKSIKIGLVLFLCHILGSMFLVFLMYKKINVKTNIKSKRIKISNIVNLSIVSSSKSMAIICANVLIFSVIQKVLSNIKYFNKISVFLEITNGINKSNNIYLIAFLLGFSSVSVWFQISSISTKSGINIVSFILSRIIHGALSSGILYAIIHIFNVSITTNASNSSMTIIKNHNRLGIAVSLFIMIIVLLSNIRQKNRGGNLLSDIV